jgi:hypothetical protein
MTQKKGNKQRARERKEDERARFGEGDEWTEPKTFESSGPKMQNVILYWESMTDRWRCLHVRTVRGSTWDSKLDTCIWRRQTSNLVPKLLLNYQLSPHT